MSSCSFPVAHTSVGEKSSRVCRVHFWFVAPATFILLLRTHHKSVIPRTCIQIHAANRPPSPSSAARKFIRMCTWSRYARTVRIPKSARRSYRQNDLRTLPDVTGHAKERELFHGSQRTPKWTSGLSSFTPFSPAPRTSSNGSRRGNPRPTPRSRYSAAAWSVIYYPFPMDGFFLYPRFDGLARRTSEGGLLYGSSVRGARRKSSSYTRDRFPRIEARWVRWIIIVRWKR